MVMMWEDKDAVTRTLWENIMRKFYSLSSIFIIALVVGFIAIGAESNAATAVKKAIVDLTAEENAWIKEHPVIRVGVDHYPPYEIVNDMGEYEGLGAEYLRRIGVSTGLNFKILSRLTWAKILEGAKNGKVDVIPVITKSPERAKFLLFTDGYLHHPQVVITRVGHSPVKGIADLREKTMAVSQGYSEIEDLKAFPTIKQVVVPDPLAELKLVSSGEVDACQGNLAVFSYYMDKYNLLNLKIAGPSDIGGSGAMAMGSRKDWPLLNSILKKGLKSIREHERIAISRKWTLALEETKSASLELTNSEQVWLNEHPVIEVAATPDWPPFEFKEKGQYKGLHADILRVAAQKAGLQIKPVFGTWSDLVDQLKKKQLDLCPGLNATDERKEYLIFTDDCVSESSQVIIASTDKPVGSIKELVGETVSVEKGYGTETFLNKNYPGIKLLVVSSTLEALKAVITGKAHAYCGNQAVALYLIKKNTFSGLGVSAFFKEAKRLQYRIGVTNDKPILRDILQKALTAITNEEMSALQEKWFGVSIAKQATKPDLKLTKAEKNWIQENQKIRIAAVSDWPPYEFKDENGHYMGISADIIRLTSHRLELEVEPVFDKWPALYKQLQQKKLDIAPGLIKDKERAQHLLFTDFFALSEDVIWTKNSEKGISSPGDLKKKTVVIEKNYLMENILKTQYPQTRVFTVNNTLEALEALSKGEADAYVGSRAVASYVMGKNYIDNIHVVTRFGGEPMRLRMGIRNDAPLLHAIMQKALNSITHKERMDIISSYIPSLMDQDKFKPVGLSPDEKAWVSAHGNIRLGVDPSFLPFEFIDPETGYGGIVSEYIDFLSKQLDVEMTPLSNLSWQEVIKKAKAGEIDILPGLTKSPEREKYLNFTKPYLSFPVVIFGHKDDQFISGLKELKGMKIGVVDGYYIQEFLAVDHPGLNLTLFNTIEEALLALSKGSVDAFINDIASTSYTINSLNIPNLNVAAITPYTLDLAMGVRKDWPELIPILEKAMETVTSPLADEFKEKWLSLKFTVGFSLKTVLKWALPIAGGLTFIIFVIMVWNRRLDKEISDRKKAQAALADAFGVITSSINYASRIQHSVLTTMDVMKELLDEFFILWKPRDVVGGDIYWGRKWGKGSLVLLADCTGHGVPGAFMTLISSGALDRALLDVKVGDAAALIQSMHQIIQQMLSQDLDIYDKDHCSDDGLELGACYIEPKKNSLTFAGAGFPLFYSNGDVFKKINGDRKGIGYRHIPKDTNWTNKILPLEKGMCFYMSSDGIFDQIGGPKRRGFGKKRFMGLLKKIQTVSMAKQGDAIYQQLIDYQGKEKRRDDVSAIGFTFSDRNPY